MCDDHDICAKNRAMNWRRKRRLLLSKNRWRAAILRNPTAVLNLIPLPGQEYASTD